MELFRVQGKINQTTRWILGFVGLLLLLIVWHFLTVGENPVLTSATLPSPWKVFSAYGDLIRDNDLIINVLYSVGLNVSGYLEAILISIPLGFLIGLIPFFQGMFQRQVDAIRYIPITALTGIFIVWFGIESPMKIHFLAFGIIIYLLPVVVQRINEVKEVYLKTVYTLGATDWQTIKTVYLPSVLSRLSDDIRVLTAISWTYIIVAEGVNSTGGIGALIWRAGMRMGRFDKVFALLLVIILFGVLQDKLFQYLDKLFFPFKYQADPYKKRSKRYSTYKLISRYLGQVIVWILLAFYIILLLDQLFHIFGDTSLIFYLFKDTNIAVHLCMICVIAYKLYGWLDSRRNIALYKGKQLADVS